MAIIKINDDLVIEKTLKKARNLNRKLRKKLSRSNVSKSNSETQTDESSLNSNFTLNVINPPRTESDDSLHVKVIP